MGHLKFGFRGLGGERCDLLKPWSISLGLGTEWILEVAEQVFAASKVGEARLKLVLEYSYEVMEFTHLLIDIVGVSIFAVLLHMPKM